MKSRMIVSALILVTAVAVGSTIFGQREPQASAFAELKVANLTCGACIARVQKAASALPGVTTVDVDVAAGSSRVAFDPARLDAARIADALTAAGYPAQLLAVVDRAQLAAQEEAHKELAQLYVGRIGERLVTREEFSAQLGRLAAGYPNGLLPAGADLWAWQELVQRELLLHDAANHQVRVDESEARQELDRMRQAMAGFDAMVIARFGSLEAYVQRLQDDLTISRHLELNVAKGETDGRLRQQRVERRLQEIAARLPVSVFDAGLKARLGAKGGCGGCC